LDDQKPFSRISLIVVTLNEEDHLERCIRSAEGVGEVIVVDSFSEDGTVELAGRLGAKVFQRPFTSAADQKNWAIEKTGLEWILILDADEALSPELRREIGQAVMGGDCDGYWLRRRNEFFGKRIRYCGWQRDRVIRLFRSGTGRYRKRAVHEKLELNGVVGRLDGYIEHVPYRDTGDYMDRLKSYSRLGAEQLRGEGRHWFPAIYLRPAARFVRMYLLQLGFLDGSAGFKLCRLAALSVYRKYSELRKLHVAGGGKDNGRPD